MIFTILNVLSFAIAFVCSFVDVNSSFKSQQLDGTTIFLQMFLQFAFEIRTCPHWNKCF